MGSLWTAMRRRWLDSGGMARLGGLNDHLLRDIGLADGDGPGGVTAVDRHPLSGRRLAPYRIRDRNLSDARTFLTLQPYR
ncbi:hypothetical protein [Azospirillum sp. B510]|uniref:hypothetical protein n=1 Tax=Azospirillum sp. (strain B510) TaxID=137722 RepID=UPI0011D15106|nr:hypothetical protein [Azospirillum sp. B510]